MFILLSYSKAKNGDGMDDSYGNLNAVGNYNTACKILV